MLLPFKSRVHQLYHAVATAGEANELVVSRSKSLIQFENLLPICSLSAVVAKQPLISLVFTICVSQVDKYKIELEFAVI